MSAGLERRYARLLRFYPAGYRRERGSELLETLLASAGDGQTRPTRQEAAGLILGGLRTRAGRDRRLSFGATWLTTVHAAVGMLLVHEAVQLAESLAYPGMFRGPAELSLTAAALVLLAYATYSAIRGRYRTAIAFATPAFVAALAAVSQGEGLRPATTSWELPLAILLLVPLIRHRPEPVRGLLRHAFLVPPALEALPHLIEEPLHPSVIVAVLAAVLLWSVVDERLTLACGLFLVPTWLFNLTVILPTAMSIPLGLGEILLLSLVAPVVLLVTAGGVARHRARL